MSCYYFHYIINYTIYYIINYIISLLYLYDRIILYYIILYYQLTSIYIDPKPTVLSMRATFTETSAMASASVDSLTATITRAPGTTTNATDSAPISTLPEKRKCKQASKQTSKQAPGVLFVILHYM